ncbi:ABC transporter substrate-binding protein [Pigmentiphaga sp. GD03639]|uniref:ABC transporter substrate-binding protein n=2 Tax=Pigmentiphaga TaxID=152267 RepID=UPI000B419001|nr:MULTISPECIES: ABC transporter substrate-binding protein [unclassified Pigmentiphaga]MDH2235195.1 ABC transporter substrate-binding protein [Pigmentiphaga sp. GD03639]OVZ63899.1 ABC transporter substrate-binding protein [Pigmentiphaga sp. NML030171]
MKMHHRLMGACLGTCVTLATLPAAHAAGQEKLKIGFMAELSGPQAALGQDMYDGFMLYLDRNGGKLGGRDISVIKADSQLKPEVGVQLTESLTGRNDVPIIVGVTFSNVMLAVHPRITQKQVFLIGTNAGPSQLAGKACSPYFFSTSWQNDQQAEVVGHYAASKGYKRIITMVPNYQSGFDFVTGFKRYYKEPLLDEVYTPLSQQDFSAELTQIAARKPDAVFVFYPGGLGVNFLRQYQQAGLLGRIPVLSASTTDAINLPAQRESALGVITGTAWGPDLDNEANRVFVAGFEKKYGRIPSHYAAQSYDGAQLLDSALRKVGGRVEDKSAFMAALRQAEFPSVRGPFKFGNNNFPVQDMHVFEVVKDARGRVTLKTIATPLKNHRDAYHAECPME